MTEIVGIASEISAAGQDLDIFARQIRQWRDVSDRLLDLHQGLTVCQHVFKRWQHKWEVYERQPDVYLSALFGHEGCHNIRLTLSTIHKISKSLRIHVDEIIGRALRFTPNKSMHSRKIDKIFVEECLQRIRRRTLWKHKFVLSVWNQAKSMEGSLARLEVFLRVLESHTNYYLEKEHPDIFSEIKRLPGRKFVLRLETDQSATVRGRMTATLASQKDAELLHRASDPDNEIHIGLSVPRIHHKDFAFLLRLNSETHEFVVRPVKIKASSNDPRVPRQLSLAVPNLTHSPSGCIVKPSSSTDGFELTIPGVSLLRALEFKAPLSSLLSTQPAYLYSQTLYTQDQNALASGIARSSVRLIGSQWLRFLDSSNVRWRRTTDGQWTSMLTASPGEGQITRALDACCAAYKLRPRGARDITRHMHIFRIGLVLAELCLKKRVEYISFDPRAQTMKIFLRYAEGVREVSATDIVAEVELLCNPYLGDIVFFCLGALTDKNRLADHDIQGDYFSVVIRNAERLEKLVKLPKRRDRRAGEARVGVVQADHQGVLALGGTWACEVSRVVWCAVMFCLYSCFWTIMGGYCGTVPLDISLTYVLIHVVFQVMNSQA